ncbi:MAG: hypothetical protein AAF741_06130 [Bacteroidota bacterium]
MEKQDYDNALNAITDGLNDGRKATLERLRKTDPEIMEANSIYRKRFTELSANYMQVPQGPQAEENFQAQSQILLRNRDEAENNKIRPGYAAVRDQALKDSFGESPKLLTQARKDLDKEPSLQWLHDPNEKKKEEKDLDYENGYQGGKVQPVVKKAPDLSIQFDDAAEKDYDKTHSKFNRAAKTKEPEYLKGYPEVPPAEGRKTKDDLHSTRDYSGSEEFPGFDDYTLSDSFNEKSMDTKDGPDMDIGD